MQLMQPVEHTTSCDSLAISMGALEGLEVFKAHEKCLIVFNFLTFICLVDHYPEYQPLLYYVNVFNTKL